MLATYFLGANTKDGFYSLYGSFPPEGAYLHVIKGGPGTGKSSFMRAVMKRAEELGYEVETVLCSGDPDSLDGVYIPALRLAWADGTAPHCLDPRCFGVNGDYVNLGQFCRTPLGGTDRSEAARLTADYKAEYAKAYSCLSAAAAVSAAYRSCAWGEAETEAVGKRLRQILADNRPDSNSKAAQRHVFLSAISCAGVVRLQDSIAALCKQIIHLESAFGADGKALKLVAAEAGRLGLSMIVCRSPLSPEEPDAVLLPDCSLAFVSSGWHIDGAKELYADALLPPCTCSDLAEERMLSARLLHEAVGHLRAAKELHDGLEKIYGRNTDFSALSEFTQQQLALPEQGVKK